MKIEKKNYLQAYLEECKYKIKKIQMSRFINAELKSDSDSDSESEYDTAVILLNLNKSKKLAVILLTLSKSKT